MTPTEAKVFAPLIDWIQQNCISKKTINRKQAWFNNYFIKQRATRETGVYVDSYQFHKLLTDLGYKSYQTVRSNDPLNKRWIYNIR